MGDRLTGQLALVTGASRGIGAATAIALAGEGAHVILTARTTGGLESVEDAIHAAGGTATIAPLDLADYTAIPRLVSAIAERWRALDMLVLNAGVLGTLGPVPSFDLKEFDKVMAVNVTANAAMIAAFSPMLRLARKGRLVGVTSSVGAAPRAYWGMYGASKAAFDTLIGCYGAEMANISPVRAAIVDPGATRTKMRERAYPGEDPQSVKPPERVADAIVRLMADGFDTGTRIRVD
jgi:NAD(P)-dependent dehydrogenase (short-subunit alcohol dehydrogenase family)